MSLGELYNGLPSCKYYCQDLPPDGNPPNLTRTWDQIQWAGSQLYYTCQQGQIKSYWNQNYIRLFINSRSILNSSMKCEPFLQSRLIF